MRVSNIVIVTKFENLDFISKCLSKIPFTLRQ